MFLLRLQQLLIVQAEFGRSELEYVCIPRRRYGVFTLCEI
jgi:hypothetical protein